MSPWRERIRAWIESGIGYHVLLVMILGLFVIQPSPGDGQGTGTLVALFNVLVFGAALFAVAENRQILVAGVLLFLTSTAFSLSGMANSRTGGLVTASVSLAFLALMVGAFLRRIFAHERVTSATLSAAACVYLFLGVGWSFAYQIALTLEPGAFSGLGDPSTDLFYFSFVSLTTLGFGDVTPVSQLARSLTVVEAVVGQLYLVLLVARLVTLYGGEKQGADASV